MTNTSRFQARLAAGLRASARDETPPQDPFDFSLVLGGPLFQIFRRAHLSGQALDLLVPRILTISLLLQVVF